VAADALSSARDAVVASEIGGIVDRIQ